MGTDTVIYYSAHNQIKLHIMQPYRRVSFIEMIFSVNPQVQSTCPVH